MSQQFVVFCTNRQPAMMKSLDFVQNKTFGEIEASLQLEDSIFFISTPYMCEAMQSDTKPLEMYPKLAQSGKFRQYFVPEYCFRIIPKSDANTVEFLVSVECTNNIKLPNFVVKFNKSLEKQTGADLKRLIDNSLGIDHSDSSFWLVDGEIKDNAEIQDIIVQARENNILMKCTLSDRGAKRVQHRKHILIEIQETERSYIKILQELTNYWKPQIIGLKTFTDTEIDTIFKEFPGVEQCHSKFLKKISKRGTEYTSIVSDIFILFSEFFKVSMPYISNYAALVKLLNQKFNTKSKTRDLRRIEENNPSGSGLEFNACLITPVQRMPRYILFLRELLKYTPNSHPDAELLEIASEKMNNVTNTLDASTKKQNKMYEVIYLQQRLGKQGDVLAPFLSKAILYQTQATANRNPANIYLFEDLVLITFPERNLNETLFYHSSIADFKYHPATPNYDSFTFSITKNTAFGPNRTNAVIQFSDPNKRKDLLMNVEQLRAKHYSKDGILLPLFLWTNPILRNVTPSITGIHGVSMNHNLYFFGGKSNSEASNKMTIINIPMGTVSEAPTPLRARYGYAASSINEKIFIFGGKNGNDYFNDLWQYNTLLNEWKELKPENSSPLLTEHSMVSFQNKLYVFGGRRKNKFYNDLFIYSFEINKWTSHNLANAPLPRSAHSVFVTGKSMIMHGGHNHNTVFNDIFIYDFTSQNWQTVKLTGSPLPPRFGHKSVLIGNCFITIGGTEDNETCQNPSVINTNDWRVSVYDCGGNNPYSVMFFGFVTDNDDNLIAYGGQEAGSKTSRNSIYTIQLPLAVRNEISKAKQAIKEHKLFKVNISKVREGTMYEPASMMKASIVRSRRHVDANRLKSAHRNSVTIHRTTSSGFLNSADLFDAKPKIQAQEQQVKLNSRAQTLTAALAPSNPQAAFQIRLMKLASQENSVEIEPEKLVRIKTEPVVQREEAKPQKPAIRPVVKTLEPVEPENINVQDILSTKPRPIDPPTTVFKEDPLCDQFGIDSSDLDQFQRKTVVNKLKKLVLLQEESNELRIYYEKITSDVQDKPQKTDFPVFIKIKDSNGRLLSLFKELSDDITEDLIKDKVHELEIPFDSLTISEEKFTNELLHKSLKSMRLNSKRYIEIRAKTT